MGRRAGLLSGNTLVGLLHDCMEETLEELHQDPEGFAIPREVMDNIIILAMDVGHPASIRDYLRRGEAHRYWHTVEAHGKGGRGYIVFNPVAREESAEPGGASPASSVA